MNDLLLKLAVALETGSGEGQVDIPTLTGDAVLQNLLYLAYFVAGIVAVVVIVVAGLNYVTSQGDSGKIAVAKNRILYAIIGLIVIIIAFAITNFVYGAF